MEIIRGRLGILGTTVALGLISLARAQSPIPIPQANQPPQPPNTKKEIKKEKTVKEELNKLQVLLTQEKDISLSECLKKIQEVNHDKIVYLIQHDSYQDEKNTYMKIITSLLQKAEASKDLQTAGELKKNIKKALLDLILKDIDFIGQEDSKAAETKAEAMKLLIKASGKEPPLTDAHVDKLLTIKYSQSRAVLQVLPKEMQIETAKRLFKEAAQALTQKTSDAGNKESRATIFIHVLSPGELKNILLETKNEYQDLIGAYLDIVSDPGKKRDITDLHHLLQRTLRNCEHDIFPPVLFSEKWYAKIEKIMDCLEQDKVSKENLIGTVATLAVLELKSDSGIQKPKLYYDLLKLTDKDPEKNWLPIAKVLLECMKKEAILNDNIKNKRVVRSPQGQILKIEPNEFLIKALEEKAKRIICNPPPEDAPDKVWDSYGEMSTIGWNLFSTPFNRPDCIIAWQAFHLEKISKAKTDDMPKLLSDFNINYQLLWPSLTNRAGETHKLIYKAGAKDLKPVLEAAFKCLLDDNAQEQDKGVKIISAMRKMYANINSDKAVPDFSENIDAKKLFISTLEALEKKGLKDEHSLSVYLGTLTNILKFSYNDPDVLKFVLKNISSQIDYNYEAKRQAKDPKELQEVHKCQVKLLQAIDQLITDLMVLDLNFSIINPLASSQESHLGWIDHIEPALKNASKKIISRCSESQILAIGLELFSKTKLLPDCSYPKNNKMKKFLEETMVNVLLKSLLESSKGLSESERSKLRTHLYGELPFIFHHPLGPRNGFALEKMLSIISENCFDPRADKDFKEFLDFINTLKKENVNDFSSNWRQAVLVKVVDQNKDYLKAITNKVSKNLKLTQDEKQIAQVLEYIKHLQYIDSLLDSRSIRTFVNTSIKELAQPFIDNLNKLKVQVEKIESTGEHIIHKEAFELTEKILKIALENQPELAPKYLEIIDARLQTEEDPHTRGMLYKTMALLPIEIQGMKGYPVLERFTKALVQETSPVTTQKIGEALAYLVLKEVDPLQIEKMNYNVDYQRYSKALENRNNSFKRFNEKLKATIQDNEINQDEITPLQKTLLSMVLYSQAKQIEPLIQDSLNVTLPKNKNEELRPEIIETAVRVLTNANTILCSYSKALTVEADKLTEKSSESHPCAAMQSTASEITNLVENNIRWDPVNSLGTKAAMLIQLYEHNLKINYEQKTDELKQKLFKGHHKLSRFEIYEENLLGRFFQNHIKSKKDEDLTNEETGCKHLLNVIDKFPAFESPKDKERYWNLCKDLGEKLQRLDSSSYSKEVTVPLVGAKIRFAKDFIALAESRKRISSLQVLKRFELLKQLDSINLQRALGELELEP